MTYHTNHCWCNKCNHNDEHFNGEVMVYFGEDLSTNFIDEHFDHKNPIPDPDFKRLTEKKPFFDEENFQMRMKYFKEKGEFLTKEEEDKEREKEKKFMMSETVTLKQEVIDWLEENIEDNKDTTEKTPINERKAWCIGNDEYNSRQSYNITVFFARQKDALNFIKKWSIYKKPTFYFDYFHDDHREMDIKEIVKITNEYSETKVDIGDKINIPHKLSTDLDETTYTMIDWESEDEE